MLTMHNERGELERQLRDTQSRIAALQSELADRVVTTEIANVDRELAEEEASQLRMELAEIQQKLDEARLDLNSIKAQTRGLQLQHHDGDATDLKQIVWQNSQLKLALAKYDVDFPSYMLRAGYVTSQT